MESKKIIRFWNFVAPLYSWFMRSNSALFDEGCRHIAPHLEHDHILLELACGTGQYTSRLQSHVSHWIATDLSDAMIAKTQVNCPYDNVEFLVADATQLSSWSAEFDVVLIGNALHIMPDPQRALEEIWRVLKPGGLLIAPTFIYDNQPSRLRMWVLSLIGFRTPHKWHSSELSHFIASKGFEVIENSVVLSKPLSQSIPIARKSPVRG